MRTKCLSFDNVSLQFTEGVSVSRPRELYTVIGEGSDLSCTDVLSLRVSETTTKRKPWVHPDPTTNSLIRDVLSTPKSSYLDTPPGRPVRKPPNTLLTPVTTR